MTKYYDGEITKIIQQTLDVKTFRIDIGEKIDFKHGQFVMLILDDIQRAFSIASLPCKDYIEITLKVEGQFTNLMNKAKVGDSISVRGPYGVFILDESQDNLVLIAGGVGIAPFMSMLRHLKNSKRDTTLIYSAKTSENFVYFEELERICKKRHLNCVFTVTRGKWKGRHGRISEGLIREVVPNLKKSVFKICGPEKMVDGVAGILLKMNVEKSRIRFEKW